MELTCAKIICTFVASICTQLPNHFLFVCSLSFSFFTCHVLFRSMTLFIVSRHGEGSTDMLIFAPCHSVDRSQTTSRQNRDVVPCSLNFGHVSTHLPSLSGSIVFTMDWLYAVFWECVNSCDQVLKVLERQFARCGPEPSGRVL